MAVSVIAWYWFGGDCNYHLQTKLQDLHCTRNIVSHGRRFPAPALLQRLAAATAASVLLSFQCQNPWNLQLKRGPVAAWGCFKNKVVRVLKWIDFRKGPVHVFARRSRTAAPCAADDSARALGGSGDSIPIAVWSCQLLCEISARILSSVPSLPLAFTLSFWFGASDCSCSLKPRKSLPLICWALSPSVAGARCCLPGRSGRWFVSLTFLCLRCVLVGFVSVLWML